MYFSNYASSLALSHSDLYMNLLSFSPKLLVCKWKEEKKKRVMENFHFRLHLFINFLFNSICLVGLITVSHDFFLHDWKLKLSHKASD